MIKNMLFAALLVGMFMMGPMYIPVPVSPRERIVYFQDVSMNRRFRDEKRLRNHYRRG